jgi:hypothetical protein
MKIPSYLKGEGLKPAFGTDTDNLRIFVRLIQQSSRINIGAARWTYSQGRQAGRIAGAAADAI